MYIVVEIFEREHVSTHSCGSLEEAIECANLLLKDHAAIMEFEDNLISDEGKDWDWNWASEESLCAWCNLGDENWDAHIIPLP